MHPLAVHGAHMATARALCSPQYPPVDPPASRAPTPQSTPIHVRRRTLPATATVRSRHMRASTRHNDPPIRAHTPAPSHATRDMRVRQFARVSGGTPSGVERPLFDTPVCGSCSSACMSTSHARFRGIVRVCRASRDVAAVRVVGRVIAVVASCVALPLGGGCVRCDTNAMGRAPVAAP